MNNKPQRLDRRKQLTNVLDVSAARVTERNTPSDGRERIVFAYEKGQATSRNLVTPSTSFVAPEVGVCLG